MVPWPVNVISSRIIDISYLKGDHRRIDNKGKRLLLPPNEAIFWFSSALCTLSLSKNSYFCASLGNIQKSSNGVKIFCQAKFCLDGTYFVDDVVP